MQSFENKAVFFQATNGGQKKDKSLFLDSNKKMKVENGMWLGKRCSGGLKKEKLAHLSPQVLICGADSWLSMEFFQ